MPLYSPTREKLKKSKDVMNGESVLAITYVRKERTILQLFPVSELLLPSGLESFSWQSMVADRLNHIKAFLLLDLGLRHKGTVFLLPSDKNVAVQVTKSFP